MEKRWKILGIDDVKTKALHNSLQINRKLCEVLINRNITTYNEAKKYFRPSLHELHDPFLMKDMDLAVRRIQTAFDNKEKILVFGDYDVDGTTSVACMYRFLGKIYDRNLLDFYIPHRYREGYGISKMGIDFAKANHFTLIISLDCGIKSIELVAYARSLGIEFIICDHHLPDEIVPDAVAILNPKQKDCHYPYKELCGCGVGFKLITALAFHFGIEEKHYFCYLDLVAAAIAADIVPMTGENRILTWFGLEKINSNPNPGIKVLTQLGGIRNKLSINNVVFVIAPRVNAAGRMDDARKAVLLFIEDNESEAYKLGEILHKDNTERKDADTLITEEAIAIIENDTLLINKKSTVVYKEHWHKGVVGIVASRLIEKYYRPTIVLTRSGNVIAGSARSIPGFNLYEAIHACRESLLGYGGHFAAAGLSLLPSNIQVFSDRFESIVSSTISPELLIPEIIIDAEIDFSDLKESFYNIICQMEPFGPGNMRPVFIARKCLDTGYSKILKERHLRLVVKQDNLIFTGIGFNLADKYELLMPRQPIDILFTVDQNVWNGIQSIQLKVIDLRISGK